MDKMFQRPERGIGADTGSFDFTLPAQDDDTPSGVVQHSLCLYENPEVGRRMGPLLLTVGISAQYPDFYTGDQTYAYSSRVGGVGIYDVSPGGQWGTLFGRIVGSLIIETQVGAVRKTMIADLAQGTYQLPPCDSVMVSAALRNPGFPSEEWRIFVAASVTPGRMAQALPLVYSDLSTIGGGDLGASVKRWFYPPPCARAARALMLIAQQDQGLFVPTPAPSMTLGAATYVQFDAPDQFGPPGYAFLSREWLDTLVAGRLAARFEQPAATPGNNSYSTCAVQWRIDP